MEQFYGNDRVSAYYLIGNNTPKHRLETERCSMEEAPVMIHTNGEFVFMIVGMGGQVRNVVFATIF